MPAPNELPEAVLLPCPFCGGDAAIKRPDGMERIVLCGPCGASGDYYVTEAEAIAAWNRRAAGDGREGEIDVAAIMRKVSVSGAEAREYAPSDHVVSLFAVQAILNEYQRERIDTAMGAGQEGCDG